MADVFSFSMAVGQTALDKSPTILKGDPSLANPVKVVKTGKWHVKKALSPICCRFRDNF